MSASLSSRPKVSSGMDTTPAVPKTSAGLSDWKRLFGFTFGLGTQAFFALTVVGLFSFLRFGVDAPSESCIVTDTILALQGVEDSTDQRTRGVQQGEQLLKLLDEVRDGLLGGGIPRQTLHRLASAISKRRESFADPKLQAVIDEIDLRARVELAKLEQSERTVA